MINKRPAAACDTECYKNYWLAKFTLVDFPSISYNVEMYDGTPFGMPFEPLDRVRLAELLQQFTIVTFNGKRYDEPMITAALIGYDLGQLKWLSDTIIQYNVKPWDLERDYNLRAPAYMDGIDLFDIMPGDHGLKFYMGKMGSKSLIDLPVPPDQLITPEQRLHLRDVYCANDVTGNIDGYKQFKKEIRLRERMSEQYGLDLRSKSDAQIAEAVIKSELKRLGVDAGKSTWAVGTYFQYDPPEFISYETPQLQNLLNVVRSARFYLGENGVDMPPELANAKINIGTSTYKLGIGGLHSSEAGVFHVSDENVELCDIDVESYYPALIINSRQYPAQLGPSFVPVYTGIRDTRVTGKAKLKELKNGIPKGQKPVTAVAAIMEDLTADTDSLKIVVNSTFGKTLSKYGALSAPKMGIQTTLTGQLSLLMLIELMETRRIAVISANTDGIITKAPRHLIPLRNEIVKYWEQRTGLKTEKTFYDFVGSASVNDYIAVKTGSREVKLKGAYAPPVPVGGSWPSPTGEICVTAVVQWLLHNTPLEQTIRACTDVRKFVYVQNVRGGGQWIQRPEIEKVTTKGKMRAQLIDAGFVESSKDMFYLPGSAAIGEPVDMKIAYKSAITILRNRDPLYREYLGKVVRYYYAKDSTGLITYVTSGNKVSNSEGCRPMMTLTDTVPGDIDYDKYVSIAKGMIQNMGVPFV